MNVILIVHAQMDSIIHDSTSDHSLYRPGGDMEVNRVYSLNQRPMDILLGLSRVDAEITSVVGYIYIAGSITIYIYIY